MFRVTNENSPDLTGTVLSWSAVLHASPADYEKEMKASSEAIFTYTDEDDGETVTVSLLRPWPQDRTLLIRFLGWISPRTSATTLGSPGFRGIETSYAAILPHATTSAKEYLQYPPNSASEGYLEQV